jgi:uncharacterized protein (DUF1697 family)
VTPGPLHVAFLRGVGGPKPARAAELKRCFGAAGFDPVVPVLATGNVVFGLGRERRPPEAGAISDLVARHFGYPLPAILRDGATVAAMVARAPFDGLAGDDRVRFVALIADDAPSPTSLAMPAPDAGYSIVAREGRDLFFAVEQEAIQRLMGRLERTFDKRVTTRNWSTIQRVAAAVAASG